MHVGSAHYRMHACDPSERPYDRDPRLVARRAMPQFARATLSKSIPTSGRKPRWACKYTLADPKHEQQDEIPEWRGAFGPDASGTIQATKKMEDDAVEVTDQGPENADARGQA